MKFMRNMLSDGIKVSSKRLITFICLIFMLIGYTANLFWGLEVKDSLFEALQWIVMAGLGFTASEKFSKIREDSSHNTITHEYDYGDEEEG